jgi:uncharacterized protein
MASKRAHTLFLILAAGSLVLSACVAAKGNPHLHEENLSIGPTTVKAEIARTPKEREMGLMFRKTLADGHGMLFVFESEDRLTFWMKNTIVPLSIAYIASDGTIKEILDMESQSLAPIPSQYSVLYALEVPQGWFIRAGVQVGDKVEIPEYARAR